MGKGPRVDCSKDVPITQQSQKDDADINVIIERVKRGAQVPFSERVPRYGDMTEVPRDLRVALNQLEFARNLFMSLDPIVRFRFGNDPVSMLEFLCDGKNRQEAIELGLIDKPKAPVAETPTPTTKAGPSGPA